MTDHERDLHLQGYANWRLEKEQKAQRNRRLDVLWELHTKRQRQEIEELERIQVQAGRISVSAGDADTRGLAEAVVRLCQSVILMRCDPPA